MKRINFNKGWKFTKGSSLDAFVAFGFRKYSEATGAAGRFYDYSNWETVDLPHDWAVSMPKETEANTNAGGRLVSNYAHYYTELHTNLDGVENIGWYRRELPVSEDMRGKRVFIEFEGVFRDSIVWVNGVYIDRQASGYNGFIYDITDHLYFGEYNAVAVRVDSDQPEGWWYEGAGIYRNVWLWVADPVYIKKNNTFVRSGTNGEVKASAALVNDTENGVERAVTLEVLDREERVVASFECSVSVPAYSETAFEGKLKIDKPKLWSIESPYLYTLRINAGDVEETKFGVRDICFDPDRGFLLNGREVKLWGACVHQDLGGVGVALTDNLHRYKIAKLKEMGVNAYRCSHNPPAPALLDACDELGMLVMDETRMFSTSPEAVRQLESLILRDRNHPSVILWSVGNEEFSVHNIPKSREIADKMCRFVKCLDSTRPTTYGGCNGANFEGANGSVDVRGINYIRNGVADWVEKYHSDHPSQPILGSEETSYVLSRGAAKTDFGSGIIDCTGDITMNWATTPKGWVKFFAERPYMAGGFMWTGFDYRGETNPYCYTNFSSSFGTIDLCGMPKPPFYYYKSQWTDEPVLKLLPHWNYGVGEEAVVLVYTNCEAVTLYLNGKKVGDYKVEPMEFLRIPLTFEPGELRAEGVRNGVKYTDVLKTSGKTAALSTRDELCATGEGDIGIVEISALDKDGVFCPLASEEIEIETSCGEIVGVGNGDPADDGYEQRIREEKYTNIYNFRCDGELYKVPPRVGNTKLERRDYLEYEENKAPFCDDYRIIAKFTGDLSAAVEKTYTTRLSGLSGYEFIKFERFSSGVEVYLNGKKIGDNLRTARGKEASFNRPYRFYCDLGEGEHELKIVAQNKNGCTTPFSGYVRAGRRIYAPYSVRLHYGLARVFVKGAAAKDLKVRLK